MNFPADTVLISPENHYVPSQDVPPQKLLITPGTPVNDVEKAVILETLKLHQFNRTHAARTLGIGVRTLQRKIRQYGADTWRPQDDG